MADVTDTFYASEGAIGYGAQFLVGQGDSPETFVALPEVERISPLVSLTTGKTRVTHLRSPNRHHEDKPTLSESQPVTVQGTFRPGHGAHKLAGGDGFSSSTNLQALRASAAETNFLIKLPDAFSVAEGLPLTGFVSKYEIGELNAENKVPFTLEITPVKSYYSFGA